MPTNIYFGKPHNLTYHNLCTKHEPPPGTKQLLGLGPKFIIQTFRPKIDYDQTFRAFRRDARLKHFFSNPDNLSNQKSEEVPYRLYIKSDWNPPPGSDTFEQKLDNFEKDIREKIMSKNSRQGTNLNKMQLQAKRLLKNNRHIIVLLADKNLGPVIMDRTTYIQRINEEHLDDADTYTKISESNALSRLDDLKGFLKRLLLPPKTNTNTNTKIPPHPTEIRKQKERIQMKDFERFFIGTTLYNENLRVPVFYGLVKIHKTPWKLRPVVSCSGSLLSTISTWIDYHLQSIRHKIPSYIRDSASLQQELDNLDFNPMDCRIGTCDAVSMYTNIDTPHMIYTLHQWFTTFKDELPSTFPCTILIESVKLVMENNIFRFGTQHFIQKTDTAMSTPCACIIAMLYYGYFERTLLLRKYQSHLQYYRRFIDDGIFIWKDNGDRKESDRTYECFKQDMNTYGKLRWTHVPLSKQTIFLDLNIRIDNTNNFIYKTYQKPMNLHLYIPPASAHPPGVIKSLIYGLLRQYHRQNSNITTFQTIVRKLFTRLIARGHRRPDLLPIFEDAIFKINRSILDTEPTTTSTTNDDDNGNRIFFKLKFHPRAISRQAIRDAFDKHCVLPITTAVSDENNTQDPNITTKCLTNIENSSNNKNNQINNNDDTKNNDNNEDILTKTRLTIAYCRDKNLRDILIPSSLHSFI